MCSHDVKTIAIESLSDCAMKYRIDKLIMIMNHSFESFEFRFDLTF